MNFTTIPKLPIRLRLFSVLAVVAISLIVLAGVSYRSLLLASDATETLHDLVGHATEVNELVTNVQSEFVNTVNNIDNGLVTWETGAKQILDSKRNFELQWTAIADQQNRDNALAEAVGELQKAYALFERLSVRQSRADLQLFLLNDLYVLVGPFIEEARRYNAQLTDDAERSFSGFSATFTQSILSNSVVILVTALVTSLIGWLTYQSILKPVRLISQTISAVQGDNADARTGLIASPDELAALGATLDQLLDEKNRTLARMESENDQLNNSIIELLEGTSLLSERDLTVRLTVREDITGPVADAMNMVTEEIGEALAKIRQISDLVGAASAVIDEQSSKVNTVSDTGRQLVVATIAKLETVSAQMFQIAKWSQASNQVAKKATASTDSAFESVTNTMTSMVEIRSSISETEKRIKRLSERSQEISSIIDIINSIAERTHVLALNASMQAAAAGDAGRGFAVVADEVQRLAESSRDSTSQISVLVRNIQAETAAAVDTMNLSISEVVAGSKLAQLAGDQMMETQATTKDLARAVAKISEQSILQARATDELKKQSTSISESTEQTRLELTRQAEQTRRLASASRALANTVSVFALPSNLLSTGLTAELLEASAVAPVISLDKAKGFSTEPLSVLPRRA
jgi:methyl-accepting chemotaxis protein